MQFPERSAKLAEGLDYGFDSHCTPMITDKEFLETEIKMGISPDNPDFVRLAEYTANQLKELDIHTVLDYGAGTGVYSDAYQRAGYDTRVFEIWEAHREFIRERFPNLPIVDTPTNEEVMSFIEVAEHMADQELLQLFEKFVPKYILFSSTSEHTDGDEAWGHINIKTQEEWISFFKNIGYSLIKDLQYPTNYSKLFKHD